MRHKKQSICLILALLVFLSGMWWENSMTDFFAEYASAGESSIPILSDGDAVSEAQLCTEEMLNVRTQVGLLQLTGRRLQPTRKVRLAQELPYSDYPISAERKFFTGSEELHFFIPCPEELVVNYIHQSDGKKRI